MNSITTDIIKAVSWRIIGTLDTAFVAWIVTGNFRMSVGIAGIEVFSKIVLYVLHERIWRKIIQGKEHKKAKVVDMY
jgi:uncharacterized membrane protein